MLDSNHKSVRARLKAGAGLAAIGIASLFAEPAYAGCTENDPVPGTTVTCTADAPNPDQDGVGDGPGSTNITLIVESGATVSNGNLGGRTTVSLGGGANIATRTGSTILGGIRIQGAGNILSLDGTVDSVSVERLRAVYHRVSCRSLATTISCRSTAASLPAHPRSRPARSIVLGIVYNFAWAPKAR
jgi:hypothetical protein